MAIAMKNEKVSGHMRLEKLQKGNPQPGLFNVDRWDIYSAQRLGRKNMYFYDCDWPQPTPRQMRRMKKKAMKNNDWSIALTIHGVDGVF